MNYSTFVSNFEDLTTNIKWYEMMIYERDDDDCNGDVFDGDDNVDPSHPHTEGGPSLGFHDDETRFVRRR